MLVQDEPLRASYMTIPAEIPAGMTVERLGTDRLPSDWRDPTALEALRTIGTQWAARLSTAVLAVPSAVVPAETNYLLNPRHPDFARIALGEPQGLVTDLRLVKIKTQSNRPLPP
jgi:RES domain-containing protein